MLLLTVLFLCLGADEPSSQELIHTGVAELLKLQEEDDAWPYQGVYRVDGEIPIGYRVAGTAIVAGTLLDAAAPDQRAAASAAIDRGVAYILPLLEHKLMQPSRADAYDVRVWGHCYALELFCKLRAAGGMGRHREAIEMWIPKLVAALLEEELPGGGWNYANRRAQATFVTAPVVQTLLVARAQGECVPDEVFERARDALRAARAETGAFVYSHRPDARDLGPAASGPARRPADTRPAASGPATRAAARPAGGPGGVAVPGAIARSPACEATLILLGSGSRERLQRAIDDFHTHWGELEQRRKQGGTHVGAYGIAPYYFYYGHRYAAQAIELLPADARPRERARLKALLLKTRDPDGTWNDRVFPRSRNYGTAMAVTALLGERQALPPGRTIGD
jgi:hypothetical protein